MQGGPKYGTKTKIGNWNEDIELLAIRENDYAAKQTTGGFSKTMSFQQDSYKSVPWTFSKDGLLHDGSSVMFKNKKTEGHLVFNLNDKQPGLLESYMVTTTTVNPGPVARSVFVMKKVEKRDVFGSDDIIRFG